jgi:trk system potassium uptake protein TrkA
MNILIIGAGDIGYQLAKRLSLDRHNITLIEQDPTKVKRAREQLDALVIEGNGASYRVLSQVKLDDIEALAAMTDREEANILACMIAKKAGVPTTLARVRNPEFAEPDFILSSEDLGVDMFIHPEKETADAVVRLIKQSNATDVLDFADGKIQVIGVRLEKGSDLLHIPLSELVAHFGNPPMRVLAIKRLQQTIVPKGYSELMAGDQIFAACDPEYVPSFIEHTGKKDTRIESIMILGGGLIGQFIAVALAREVNIKIIESDADKSQQIADLLADTLIIHGDGTDIDLLATEGLLDMDAFIAVTGDDETNIIAALVARHLKIPRTIALVNKIEYLPITPQIGMDAVVSKQLLTVNAVQRFIQHKQATSIASLPGLDAQFMEFIAQKDSKITRKPLAELHFPKQAIIGAVMRDDKMIIAMGDTHIRPGDRVVVFAQSQALEDVEKLFKK